MSEVGDDLMTDLVDGGDLIDLTAFGIAPTEFATVVDPALSEASESAVFLDLEALGGQGSVLIEGLAIADADQTDFLL